MNRAPAPLWAWPGWNHLGHTALCALAVTGWFALVFGGADYLTAQRSSRVRLHFDAELNYLFIPASVLGYLSIYPLLWSAPFILRGAQEVRALGGAMAVIISAAGLGFLLFPADSVFPPRDELGIWTIPVRWAKRMALDHNMMPSLHVAMSVLCTAAYAGRAGLAWKLVLWSWAGVIALSTLFLHQHYLVDVLTGCALGLAGYQWCYCRWGRTRHESAGQIPGASPPSRRGQLA